MWNKAKEKPSMHIEFEDLWIGHYQIEKVIGFNSYIIKDLDGIVHKLLVNGYHLNFSSPNVVVVIVAIVYSLHLYITISIFLLFFRLDDSITELRRQLVWLWCCQQPAKGSLSHSWSQWLIKFSTTFMISVPFVSGAKFLEMIKCSLVCGSSTSQNPPKSPPMRDAFPILIF